MGGFMASTAGSVAGLVTGFFSLEAAQVAVDRAQLRVNTSTLQVQKAQDAYSKAVAKFGPDSRQAQEALSNLHNKSEALGIAQERLTVTQDRQREAWMSLGIQLITVGGSFAQMGSTLSVLGGKLAGTTAAADLTAASEVRLGASADAAAIGQNAASAASLRAGASMRLAALGAFLLSSSFLEIAIPVGIIIGLFALIETNTFGMGDAFRSTVTVISVGIDAIANGLIGLWNQFVLFANSMSQWGAIINNVWVTVHDSFAKTFNAIISGAATFVQQLENTVKQIYNFFVTDVINPVIGAWNNFMLGLQLAWNSTVSTLAKAFQPVVDTVLGGLAKLVGAFAILPGAAGAPFKGLQDQIVGMQKSFDSLAGSGTQSADQIKAHFAGINTIKLAQIDVTNFNQSFIPLIGTYQNVAAAGHTFDSFLKQQNVTVAEDIAKSVEYYSHWNNVQALFTGKLGPALQAIVKYVWDNVQGGAAWISKLLGVNSALGTTTAAVDKHGASLQKAAALTSDYGNKVAEAAKKNADLANMIAHGTELQDAANAGYQKASELLLKLKVDTADEWGQVARYNQALQDGTLYQDNYNKGLADGALKYTDLIAKTAQTVGEQNAYNTMLTETVGKLDIFNGALERSPKNFELATKAMAGSKEALQELQKQLQATYDWFFKLGEAAGSKLADAMDKGHKAFSKAVKDMEKTLGDFKFDREGKFALSVSTSFELAKKRLDAGLGSLAALIYARNPDVARAGESLIASLTNTIQKGGGQITAGWQKIFDDIRTITSQPIGSVAFNNALGDMKRQMDAMGVPAASLNGILGTLGGGVKGVGAAAAGAAGPVGAFAVALDSFKAQAILAKGAVDIWGVALSGVAQIFNVRFKQAVNDAAGYLKMLNDFIHTFVTAALVNSLGKGVQNAAVAVNTAFRTMQTDVAGYTKQMTALIQQFVRTGLIDSLQKGVTAAVAVVQSGFKSMFAVIDQSAKAMTATIQAFVRTGLINSLEAGVTNAQRVVATAFNAMLSTVRSTTGQMISQINALKAAILSIPTSHTTVFLGNVSNLASAVAQAKSLINSVPTSHTTTLTIIRRVIVQPVPAPAPFPRSLEETAAAPPATTTTSVIGVPVARGPVGYETSAQLDRIIALLTQIAAKDQIITMDGKEIGRLVRRHIFENVGAYT